MSLDVAVRHAFPGFTLDAAIAEGGSLVALFGRSGSGKTSLVQAVAGLLKPDRGRIVVDDRVLLDTERGIFVAPHRRRIGYVFQEGRLFPHLSVRGNLLYGWKRAPRAERTTTLGAVVDLLGLGALLDRAPQRLSGGEKQRVAIGRALLAAPRLLLMDEPLAALDDARKNEVLPFIERLRDEARMPILYVSHSVAEVRRLATTLVVLADGRVVATGAAEAVLRRLDLFPLASEAEPGSEVDARVERHDEAFDLTLLASPAGPLRIPRVSAAPGTPVRVRIRARDVMIATRRPEGLSALNVIEGRIRAITAAGEAGADVVLDCGGIAITARLTRQSVAVLGLAPGRPVFAVVKSIAFER